MSTQKIQPKVTLVGAGPGDAELITIKAVKALGTADVILYDALVNEELLKYTPVHAEKIFVGKREGQHSFSQDEINTLIVNNAFTHGHVVRLKGGDPFVFGRGLEEIEYAGSFGIPAEWIPGISSAIGVPASLGIPVTHRGTSESFWVITGRNSKGNIPDDITLAARSGATVVILMGLGKLEEISAIYRKHGRNDLPVAVIQDGTLPGENAAFGTIDTIVETVRQEQIKAPAVIVIGEVVRKNPQAAHILSTADHFIKS